MNYTPVTTTELVLAALLVLLDAGLSLVLRLGLERRLVIAGVRMVAQLLLVGLLLRALFAAASPLVTIIALFVMMLAAGYEVAARQERRLAGWWAYGLGPGAMAGAAIAVVLFGLLIQAAGHLPEGATEPGARRVWLDPRYVVPLTGIILGNVMNGVSISLSIFTAGVERNRLAIEARLALGAPIREAFRPLMREALRGGLIPIINQMSAAGIVTLPGMMTGQILAGMDPIEAVKYQILILFLLAGGAALGGLGAVYGAAARLTDDRDRLRLDRLQIPTG